MLYYKIIIYIELGRLPYLCLKVLTIKLSYIIYRFKLGLINTGTLSDSVTTAQLDSYPHQLYKTRYYSTIHYYFPLNHLVRAPDIRITTLLLYGPLRIGLTPYRSGSRPYRIGFIPMLPVYHLLLMDCVLTRVTQSLKSSYTTTNVELHNHKSRVTLP